MYSLVNLYFYCLRPTKEEKLFLKGWYPGSSMAYLELSLMLNANSKSSFDPALEDHYTLLDLALVPNTSWRSILKIFRNMNFRILYRVKNIGWFQFHMTHFCYFFILPLKYTELSQKISMTSGYMVCWLHRLLQFLCCQIHLFFFYEVSVSLWNTLFASRLHRYIHYFIRRF